MAAQGWTRHASLASLCAIVALFAYASLEIRHLFHGAEMDILRGFTAPELYAYSAAWLALGILLTVINAARSLKRGTLAGSDPWKANTLEWFTTSPPPVNNFDVIPRVRSVEPMKDIRREIERRTSGTPSVVSAWMSERATRECTMSPTIATVRLAKSFL